MEMFSWFIIRSTLTSDLWHTTGEHWFEPRWLLPGTVSPWLQQGKRPSYLGPLAVCTSVMNTELSGLGHGALAQCYSQPWGVYLQYTDTTYTTEMYLVLYCYSSLHSMSSIHTKYAFGHNVVILRDNFPCLHFKKVTSCLFVLLLQTPIQNTAYTFLCHLHEK